VDLLARQPWRGNVRELRNFIYRLALLAREDVIDAAALTPCWPVPRGPRMSLSHRRHRSGNQRLPLAEHA
jgi:DNA-binding NtrC family response regulator